MNAAEAGTTLKSAFSALWKVVSGAAKSVHKLIMGADLATLIKYGIVAGISYVVIRVIFRYIKDRKRLYHAEENKSMVDRALEMNYADARNQQELHPLMKKVRKNLHHGMSRDKKEESRKKICRGRKKYQGCIDKLARERIRRDLPQKIDDIREYLMEEELDTGPSNIDLAELWHAHLL